MGKLTSFTITLESPAVFAGEFVRGKVTIVLNDAMSMKGVYLNCVGKAQTAFKTGKYTSTGEEDFIDNVIVLKGHSPEESGDKITLPAGSHELPFNFQLLESLPSSFENPNGHIRYKLKAIIKKPWKFDHTTKQVFTVVGICDLNKLPNALTPLTSKNETTLRSLKLKSGILSAMIRTDRKGYVPGEKMRFSGEISNKTTRDISYSKISFKVMMKFKAEAFEIDESRKIAEVKRDAIKPGGTDSFDNLVMRIPSIPPCTLQGCAIIKVKYVVKLTVQPHLSSPLVVSHEIAIGTIPVTSSVSDAADSSTPTSDDSSPNSGCASPPTFKQCVWGPTDTQEADDNQHTRGQHLWAPSYPYYSSE